MVAEAALSEKYGLLLLSDFPRNKTTQSPIDAPSRHLREVHPTMPGGGKQRVLSHYFFKLGSGKGGKKNSKQEVKKQVDTFPIFFCSFFRFRQLRPKALHI